MKERTEKITSLICSSFQPSGAIGADETVGICVFTGSGMQINAEISHKFLRERTELFHKNYVNYIKNGNVTTLASRIDENNGEPDF